MGFGSEATTALALLGVKTIVYQQYISLDSVYWFKSAFMGLAMILGTRVALRVIERMSREKHQRCVAVLLIIVAASMLVHGKGRHAMSAISYG